MTDKYCTLGEVKKLEIELWNLKVRDNDIPAYTNRFQELALICTKFVSNETEKVDKYISGLPDNIYGNVKSSKPKTLNETIELANDLMDQKLRTYAERKSDSKRKADDISRNNQQPFKKKNVAKAYNLGSAEKKNYETTYLRNEITNFLQKSNETFNEAWERFKDLLRQCPHHGFSELHQLDTFYNALTPNDQDALDSAASGNFLDNVH
nr:reverse transcriptase domain-containing protein [Tanacetum cinerariifolium]